MRDRDGSILKNLFEAKTQVANYLRNIPGADTRTLSPKELGEYKHPKFAYGWEIKDPAREMFFRVLLPEQFPFVIPRIAIRDATGVRDYTDWPHVEGAGLLCLDKVELQNLASEPVRAIELSLASALRFVDEMSSRTDLDKDFGDEFISYWNRRNIDETKVLSLLDIDNESTRKVLFLSTSDHLIVGESKEELLSWVKNRYPKTEKINPREGIFVKLETPPVPPFPETLEALEIFLSKHGGAAALALLAGSIGAQGSLSLVMQGEGRGGKAMVAIQVHIKNAKNFMKGGFRSMERMPEWLVMQRLRNGTNVVRHGVQRIDGSWVHGRGQNIDFKSLADKRVTVLGCGSLGSHIAVRLAQAGVGDLLLIDPEILEAANVGRHVLGMSYLNASKAGALAYELGKRFPHMRRVEGIPKSWEQLPKADLAKLKDSDLIISAVGEWGPEGILSDWQVQNPDEVPTIIYGWLEEHAAAAHALLVNEQPGCLNCLLSNDGNMTAPETEWETGNELQAEPACGSLYQPFGPMDLANAEAMISRMAVDTLLGRYTNNTHRVSAISTWHLNQMGGRWSAQHLAARPNGFEDHFEFERVFVPKIDCQSCGTSN